MKPSSVDTLNLPCDYTYLEWWERKDVRERYVQLQDGECMFCDASLAEGAPDSVTAKKINWRRFPKNFLKYPVHLQHCHKTGMTEGAVHAYCNAVMWQYHGR